MNNKPTRRRLVLPVIHHLDASTSRDQAALAFRAGADGVFLISHDGRDGELPDVARVIKATHGDRLVGLNLLSLPADRALAVAQGADVDMLWVDNPGVSSAGISAIGAALLKKMELRPDGPRVFGSVAFKYQPHEARPGMAALNVMHSGMLPTTSGPGTGEAPDMDKARSMSASIGGAELAVASGMTPENVGDFLPYFTHYLVATGVSRDMHHFDEARLVEFVRIVKSYETGTALDGSRP